MSSITKLAIRGIRSFDDKSISVIEFYSPVTVIVGHNGSGKTTIIECLKYATTGDQPPNTKGGAFIHDPKMANEKEVKAQVKLRFNAANGRKMLAVRNLSVTLKKNNAMAMKTLENILAVADPEKGGKRGVLSTKCAEIDNEIPHLLGVSKAVLENVIFCHQEESYWPLAEPSILKKKFDDIFESTKYTKALENIKSLRKDRVAELKTDKERLTSLELEKGHSDRLNARMKRLTSDIEKKETEYGTLKEELEQLVEQNRKLAETYSRFREAFIENRNLLRQKENLESDLQEGLENLVELPLTDDELADRKQNFERYCQQAQLRRERKQKDLVREQESQKQDHSELLQLIEQKAKLQADQNVFEKNVESRIELVRTVSVELDIRGFDIPNLDESQIDDFRDKLREARKRRKATLEEVQREGAAKQDQLNSKYRELEHKRSAITNRRDRLREDLVKAQKQIQDTEASLGASDMVSVELASLAAEKEEKRARLKRSEKSRAQVNYETRSSEIASQTSKLEEQREALSNELQYMSAHSESRAKLDLKQDEVRRKRLELKATVEANQTKIRRLFDEDLEPADLVSKTEESHRSQEESFAKLQKENASIGQSLHHAEQTISQLEVRVASKKKEVKDLEKKLRAELEDMKSLQEAIKSANEEIVFAQGEYESLRGSTKIYGSLLRQGVKAGRCVACDRTMDRGDLEKFETYLKGRIKASEGGEEVATLKEDLDNWKTELGRLEKLMPMDNQLSGIRDIELPELENQLKEERDRLPSFVAQHEKLAEQLQKGTKDLKELAALKQTAAIIHRLNSSIAELARDINSLEDELSKTGSSKTANQVKDELDEVSAKIRKTQRERNNLIEEKERHSEAHRQIENELHSLDVRERELQSTLKERLSLENGLEQLQREVASNSMLLKESESNIQEATIPLNEISEEQEKFQRSHSLQVEEAREHQQAVNQIADKLDAADRRVEEYTKGKYARQLQDCISQIKSLETQIEQTLQSIEELRSGLQDLDKELNESGSTATKIKENVRIRKIRTQIKEVQSSIDSLNLEAVGQGREDYEQTYKEAKEIEVQVQSKCAHLGGEIKSQKDQLQDTRKEAKMYEGIYKRYREQVLKVKMAGMANDDLEKYAKALDAAIMKYHTLKMEEVNDTMRHLWNKTYQGTDIDSIKIRSDNEVSGNRRSYNYRVVMMKDQVEMDMRGRCSAGQKMLASIIIRLALSDSFGQNCGILALDEPTNALDIDNIDSLASSLIDIINERKNISNFQLIIITHDETFLQKLAQNSAMEYYWRVSRDPRQKSVIQRQRAG